MNSSKNLTISPPVMIPGCVAQSVKCLATDTSLTADPGVGSLIPAWSRTFLEIDHEIIQGSHRPEKYLNLEGFLEKSLKIKSAFENYWKITEALKNP